MPVGLHINSDVKTQIYLLGKLETTLSLNLFNVWNNFQVDGSGSRSHSLQVETKSVHNSDLT